jgi:hypothetical protein
VKLLLVLSCVVACLALPAQAAAKTRYLTPPGNSGITQYTEVVPSSGGSTPSGGVPNSPATHLPPAAARALAGPGAARKELSKFVAATGQPARSGRHSVASGSNPSGSSGATSVLRSLSGHGGGMGLVLPLALVAALLGVVALGWRRRSGFRA